MKTKKLTLKDVVTAAHEAGVHVEISLRPKPTGPQRIQLSRKKGFKLPPNTVNVARPGIFGNPYSVTPMLLQMLNGNKMEAQQACVNAFRDWLDGSAEGDELRTIARQKLRGKNLACWCRIGTPCHADVLLKISNFK